MAAPQEAPAIAAGLLSGGVAGLVLGVPGVSGVQTTTIPNTGPATTPRSGEVKPDGAGSIDGESCPEKRRLRRLGRLEKIQQRHQFRRGAGARL